MNLKKLLFLAICITTISTVQAQTLKEIVKQVLTVTTGRNLTIPQYFELTKRYAKLDVHPTVSQVALPGRKDSIQAKSVSFYIWGVVAHEILKIPIKEARMYPNALVKDGNKNKKYYMEEVFRKNRFEFLSLVGKIQKSKSSVFVQQMKSPNDKYVRVDSIFKEKNNLYWQYRLPAASQFSISTDIDTLTQYAFSPLDKSILEKLENLNIYCAYKENNKIIFIVSGLLDNMIGYVYSKEPFDKTYTSPSLHFSILEPAGENFYYYVSN